MITEKQLQKILKMDEVSEWFKAISELFPLYSLTTKERIAGFLSQTGHESGDFKILTENLKYSAEGLDKIFSKYFKNAGRDAIKYAKQPEKIANIVYANRMGNGSIESGDGWKYRGGGLLQLTGKTNYLSFSKSINKDISECVNYVRTPKGAIESALWFWKTNNLNLFCDKKDLKGLTLKINGGTTGLEDRITRFNSIMTILA